MKFSTKLYFTFLVFLTGLVLERQAVARELIEIRAGGLHQLPNCGGSVKLSPEGQLGYYLDFVGMRACSKIEGIGFAKNLERRYKTYNGSLYLPKGVDYFELRVSSSDPGRGRYDRIIVREGRSSITPNPVQNSPHIEVKPYAFAAEVIEKRCSRLFFDKEKQKECLRLSLHLTPELIKLCGRSFFQEGERLKCLGLVGGGPTLPEIANLKLCTRNFYDVGNKLDCFGFASKLGQGLEAVLANCRKQHIAPPDRFKCLKQASDGFVVDQESDYPACQTSCRAITTDNSTMCSQLGCQWTQTKGKISCIGSYNRCLR